LDKAGTIRRTGRKAVGTDSRAPLRDCGCADAEIGGLAQDGVIAAP